MAGHPPRAKAMTPFQQGQAAAREGKPQAANPHPPGIKTGHDYPGDWANWRAGWINETATKEHDARAKCT